MGRGGGTCSKVLGGDRRPCGSQTLKSLSYPTNRSNNLDAEELCNRGCRKLRISALVPDIDDGAENAAVENAGVRLETKE